MQSDTGQGERRGAKKATMRVTVASLLGTTLEFYDNFIYGTAAALVFPKVFFVDSSPEMALMLSFLTYGIAYAARPLGAVLFGHFGDRLGRKWMLVLALLMMGMATFCVGLLPPYASWGMWSVFFLCFLRLLQGIALGGEWGGAALMVNEFAHDSKWKGVLGSMVQLASPIGFLMASGVFAAITFALSDEAFLAWGWRLPFLFSAVLIVLGFYVRFSIEESPEFVANRKIAPQQSEVPLVRVVRHYWKQLLLAIGTRIGSDAAFYIFALFLQVYLPMHGISRQVALQASIAAALGQAAGIPVFGYLCDKYSTRTVLLLGSVLTIIWAFVHFMLVDTYNTGIILSSSFIALFFLAALWAPLAAHLPPMFPVDVRFTGTAVGYQAASMFGGAIAPAVCIALVTTYGSTLPISLYLAGMLAVGFVCVLLTPEISSRRKENSDPFEAGA